MSEKRRQSTRRIKEILLNRGSALVSQVEDVYAISKLPHKLRQQIAEQLGDELCERGLNPDDEPNDYGLELEDLIDACRPRES